MIASGAHARAIRSSASQLALERLPHERMPEAAVRFFLRESESARLVDGTGGVEPTVGPQHDAPVAGGAGEREAFVDEPLAEAEAARGRLDQQQAQLRHPRRALHEEHAPHALAIPL